jgi:hypothetical protein
MNWLDKHVEEQREQQEIILKLTGGVDPAELQEMAEFYNWEATDETQATARRS